MGDRVAKCALFTEFAAVGKALGNPSRLDLLDVLAQGPRGVDELAAATAMGISTCSAHLQSLREAGLVRSVRDGKRVINHLTDQDVAQLLVSLRAVALRHRPGTDRARRAYLGPDDTEAITRADLLHRAQQGMVTILDVRPQVEYAAAHLAGALSIPVDELADRLDEIPADTEVVAYCRGAYCVMAHDAVRVLRAHGFRARRTEDGVLEWHSAGLLPPTRAA